MRYGTPSSRVNRRTLTRSNGLSSDILAIWIFDQAQSAVTLVLADAAHNHSAERLQISTEGSHSVSLADAAHAHIAETVTLSQGHVIDLADAAHNHAANMISISEGGALVPVVLMLQVRSTTRSAEMRGEAIDLPTRLLEFSLGKRDSRGGEE